MDIAEFLYELPLEKQLLVFRILPKELAAETFVEMDSESCEYMIKAFSDKETREIFEELFLDDMVDIIEEMPANVVKPKDSAVYSLPNVSSFDHAAAVESFRLPASVTAMISPV